MLLDWRTVDLLGGHGLLRRPPFQNRSSCSRAAFLSWGGGVSGPPRGLWTPFDERNETRTLEIRNIEPQVGLGQCRWIGEQWTP